MTSPYCSTFGKVGASVGVYLLDGKNYPLVTDLTAVSHLNTNPTMLSSAPAHPA